MFSIVIPCFNCADTIIRCLESIENCGFNQQSEIIIVDDGSTDDTPQVVRSYGSSLSIILIRRENSGVSNARNTGIAYARNPWIVFVDADDILIEGYKEALTDNIGEGVSVVCFDASYISSIRCSIHSSNPAWLRFMAPRQRISYINFVTTSGTCVCKRLLGQERFRKNLVVAQDWDFWIRLGMRGDIVYVPKLVVGYMTSTTGLSNRRWRQLKEEIAILLRYAYPKRHSAMLALTLASGIRLSLLYVCCLARVKDKSAMLDQVIRSVKQ